MNADLQSLLHNKKALYGVGIAGAVGIGVWYTRRNKSGSAGAASSGTSYGAIGNPASVDTTGTDVAAWLGQYGGSLQAQLDAYQKQLTDTLGALQGSGNGSVGTPPPKPKPVPSPAPAPNPGGPTHGNPNPAGRFITTTAFTKVNPAWNSTLSGIAGHEHTTVAALMKLNPNIHNPNLIGSHQQIRVG